MQFGAEVLKKNLCPNISSALAKCVFNSLMFTKLSYFQLAPRAWSMYKKWAEDGIRTIVLIWNVANLINMSINATNAFCLRKVLFVNVFARDIKASGLDEIDMNSA
jgi:hypothetical protein